MKPCDQYAGTILRFLDRELSSGELEDFRLHLETCANCQMRVEEERALSELLHQSRPLYSAPAALRARVSGAMNEHSPATAAVGGTYGCAKVLVARLSTAVQRMGSVRAWAVVAAVVLVLCLLLSSTVREVRAASYVETALATHRSYVNGDLSPQLQSSSSEAVTAWLADKVPFSFRLPKAQLAGEGDPVYQMTGALLVDYKGSPAALVTYQGKAEKVSLLVASSKTAVVAGGEQERLGKLIFHYRNDASFRVATWSAHGLSYAVVSPVAGPPRRSCLVCHQNMPDHQSFR